MKNLITKKLALLAIVLFAGIGHAFGANATVSITDDKGASVERVVDLSFSGEDYAWTQWDDIIEIPTGEDVWMNAYLVKSQYEIINIYIGENDVLPECSFYEGYYSYKLPNPSEDISVRVVVKEVPSKTITIDFQTEGDVNYYFEDGYSNISENPAVLACGRNVKMHIIPSPGYELDEVVLRDENNNTTTITRAFDNNGFYVFEQFSANYTVLVTLKSVPCHTIKVVYDTEVGYASLMSYQTVPGNNYYWADPQNGNLVNKGYNVRLKAGANNYDKEVISFLVDNVEKISEFRVNQYYEFMNVSTDHNVTVTYGAKPTATFNYDDSQGQILVSNYNWAPSGSICYFNMGSSVRIEPAPQTGFRVSSVTVNGSALALTDEGYYEFTITENSTVNVLFEEMPSVTVYYNEDYGEVVINENSDNLCPLSSESCYFPSGSTVRITPHPNTGYIVSSVTVGDTPVTMTNGSYEFTLTESCYITVEFERPIHSISYTFNRDDIAGIFVSWTGGSTNVNGTSSITVMEGSDVYMWTDWIDDSYQVKSFKVDDIDYTETFKSGGYSLSNVTSDHSVSVELETIQPSNAFNVSFNHEGFGDICINDNHIGRCVSKNQTIDTNMGDNIWVSYYLYSSAHPLKSITIDNVDVTNEFKQHDGYSIPNNSSDHSIYVEYDILESNTISVILQEGNAEIKFEDGDIAVWGQKALFAKGHSVKMYLTPTAGSEISSVSIDDGSNIQDVSSYFQANGGYYEFTSVNTDYTVTVLFTEVETRTITLNYNNERGTVYINDRGAGPYEFTYNLGSTIRLTTNPRGGYKVGSIFVDEEEVTNFYNTNGYYEFVLNSNSAITVNFVEATYYTVSVSCDNPENGYYSLNQEGDVIEGADIYLSVNPYTGYVPIVTDNGAVVVLTQEHGSYYYEINDLDADHTINVRFDEAETSNIYLSINENETKEVYLNNNSRSDSGYFMLTTGTTARLVVDPQIGYELESIIIDNDDVTDDYKANGYYDLVVKECIISVTMKKKLAPETIPFTLSDLGIGTFCYEFDLDFSNVRGIKAYVASGFNPISKQLVLTKVDEVPAGTGILIKGSSGDYQIPTTETYFCYANMLKGVVKDTYIPENSWEEEWNGYGLYAHYLLGDDGEFYRTNGEELPANSAYLTIPTKYVDSSSLAKIGLIFLDDEEEVGGITTGVGYIWAGENRTVTTDAIYNLQGQKVTEKSLKPGIYIKNGKKFMVK